MYSKLCKNKNKEKKKIMILIFLMFFWGMSDFVCMYYDFCFKGLEVIICNDMWLFGIYFKEIIVMDIDDVIVEIVFELKK